MPGVLHDGVDDHGNRRIQVGIGKHDLRAFAAEFQRDRAMALGRHLLDERAYRGAAGKADVVYALVAGQRVADFMAVTGHDVDRAGREADLGGQFGHTQQRQAGVFGRFDHANIAGGQRTAHAAAEDLHGVVPRDDVAGHAMRLAPGHHAVAVQVGNGLAVQLACGAGIKLEVAHQRGGVGFGLPGGFAAVALLDQRQLIGVRRHPGRQAHQQAAALGGADALPDQVQAFAGRVDRGVNVAGIAALYLVKHLAVRRVYDRDGFAGRRRDGGVGDVIELHALILLQAG